MVSLFLLLVLISFIWNFSNRVYMKIQEVIMKKLDCSSMEQVEEQYLVTSSDKSLQEYFIVLRDWVHEVNRSDYFKYKLHVSISTTCNCKIS